MTPALLPLHETVQRLVTFFEHLQPQDLPRLKDFYAVDAHFKDPFNDVRGLRDIERIFAHMFDALNEPHFVVTARLAQDRQCFITWDFRFRFKGFDSGTWQTVRGGTHVIFDDQGRVIEHRDYWDAAEELYEKIPLLGGLMRWLRRRANR
jgi:ketosteroid isomerase-like protein